MITAEEALMLEEWDGSPLTLNGQIVIKGGSLSEWKRSAMGPFKMRDAPARVLAGDYTGKECVIILFRHLDTSKYSCELAIGAAVSVPPEKLINVLSVKEPG